MTDNELKKLAEDVKHIYPKKQCQFSLVVLLPFWELTADVWAIERAGPHQLDQIFFRLLQNGVNTRKEIARRLGVDAEEFIFIHLDILVREKYVVENEGVYAIADLGKKFIEGDFKEERFILRKKFPFFWNSIGNYIDSKSHGVVKKKGNFMIEAEIPSDNDLLSALPKYFNEEKDHRVKGIIFYDVDSRGSRHWFRYKPVYNEYVVLFYTPDNKEDADEWHIDLRVRNDDSGHFKLCEVLTKNVNENAQWREQFEKIYESNKGKIA